MAQLTSDGYGKMFKGQSAQGGAQQTKDFHPEDPCLLLRLYTYVKATVLLMFRQQPMVQKNEANAEVP